MYIHAYAQWFMYVYVLLVAIVYVQARAYKLIDK